MPLRTCQSRKACPSPALSSTSRSQGLPPLSSRDAHVPQRQPYVHRLDAFWDILKLWIGQRHHQKDKDCTWRGRIWRLSWWGWRLSWWGWSVIKRHDGIGCKEHTELQLNNKGLQMSWQDVDIAHTYLENTGCTTFKKSLVSPSCVTPTSVLNCSHPILIENRAW